MSILIKGMEIPKSCRKCLISQPDGCGFICPIVTGKPIVDSLINSRHPRCPLVPVPPHGDLVDRREAIIDANERAYDFWLSDDEVNSTIQFLNEQAAVIPAEPGEEEKT